MILCGFIDGAKRLVAALIILASEIGIKDEHATPDEAISAYNNHPSIVKFRDACGDNMKSLNFQTVNHDCAARKLQKINIRKATGYDNIPAKLTGLAENELTHPIANLINNTTTKVRYAESLIQKGGQPQ